MKKTFIDELVSVFDAIENPGFSDAVFETKRFLKSLPGVILVEDEILPIGIAIKGVAVLCSLEEFSKLRADEKEKKKIQFQFSVHFDNTPKNAWAFQYERFNCSGSWKKIVETIVDHLSPGDRLMSLGFREINFFSQN